MFPVGTIIPYAGDLSKIPYGWHLCDGTNGTPDLSERFLEGTTTTPKTFKDAGLPNITGSFFAYDNGTYDMGFGELNSNGAIHGINNYWATIEENLIGSHGAFHGTREEVIKMSQSFSSPSYEIEAEAERQFNASWSNSIYGVSDTVQPKSYTVYYIMRVM